MELGLVPVFAENTGNVRFVDMIIRNGSPRANGRQQRRDQEDINQYVFHLDAKVGRDFGDLPDRRQKVCEAIRQNKGYLPLRRWYTKEDSPGNLRRRDDQFTSTSSISC